MFVVLFPLARCPFLVGKVPLKKVGTLIPYSNLSTGGPRFQRECLTTWKDVLIFFRGLNQMEE